MIVGTVSDESMAAAAGIERGDVVRAIDHRPVRSLRELRAALAALGDHATIETTREQATVAVHRRACVPGTAYEHVLSRGARLRTLIERKPSARATALFLQGIAPSSIEDATPVDAVLRPLDVTTTRLERRGVGDSEGDLPDFAQEVEDYRAALAAIAGPVILIGHSVGGMTAPLLYDERVAAIAVIGTSSRRWLECLDASARRQATLAGIEPEAAVRGQRAEIEADRDERSRAFHEQLDAVDLRAAWSRVRCPVLVLHGEYDWVVGEDESRELAELVPRARFALIRGLDHAMTFHPSLTASREAFGRGELDDRVGVAIAKFLRDDVPHGEPAAV